MPAKNVYTIAAGELRHRVQIQQQSTTQDEFGGQIATWSTILSPRAKIASTQLKESFQSGQFSGQATYVVTIRWVSKPNILGGMRVVFTERGGNVHTYLIQTVDNVELRNVKVNLMCVEIDGVQ